MAFLSEQEKAFFLENGYLVKERAIRDDTLTRVQEAFDEVWEQHGTRVGMPDLLRHRTFIDLMEDEAILDVHRTFFGGQVQLLAYDLLRQGPGSAFPERAWHRDFVFPGDYPLAINTILFIDDMTAEKGPTRVVPRTHTGLQLPSPDQASRPLEGEIAVEVPAGSAIFINAAVWHTGARNRSDGLRRGIYLYYGYWWLKRYNLDRELPWEAFEEASEERIRLLGVKMPGGDLHMYDPGA